MQVPAAGTADRRLPLERPRALLARLRPAALTGLVALTALAAGCDQTSSSATARTQPAEEEALAPAVEVVAARSGRLPLEERLSGIVRASNQISVRAEVDAAIVEVFVRSGDAVERGQPLVRLDAVGLRHRERQAEANVRLEEAAVRGAQARVAELEAQVERTRQLARESLVTRLEIEVLEAQLAGARASADQAAARVDLSRAALEEQREALTKTTVRAPVAGRVGRRRAEVGMLTDASTVLFELGNLDEVIVEVPLTSEMLGFMREGQPVRITAGALGDAPLSATLSRIPPFLAAETLSTSAEIDIPDAAGRLYPGMFVTVDVLYGETEEATIVPTCALWEDPITGIEGLFVADFAGLAAPDDGDPLLAAEASPVALRRVEVLGRGRSTVGVRGVEPDEWVVTIGQHLLAREGGLGTARLRPARWERVLELQGRHREDLLREFLAEQERVARTHGAEPPSNEEFLSTGGGGAPAAPPAEPLTPPAAAVPTSTPGGR